MLARAVLSIPCAFGWVSLAHAAPLRRNVLPILTAELSGFAPYTQFARAAYCPTSKLTSWDCGGAWCRIGLFLQIKATAVQPLVMRFPDSNPPLLAGTEIRSRSVRFRLI